MVTEARMEKLFWELRGKYLAASNGRVTTYEIMWDLRGLKKYSRLSPDEKAALFERAVCACDGDASFEYVVEEEQGNITGLFQ